MQNQASPKPQGTPVQNQATPAPVVQNQATPAPVVQNQASPKPQATPVQNQASPKPQATPVQNQASPAPKPQTTPVQNQASPKPQVQNQIIPIKQTEILAPAPAPNKIMNFLEMRNFIRDNYIEYTWPKVKLENLCIPKAGAEIVNLTPTQSLISNLFTPNSAYKGMLLWHSVGTGKCWLKDTPILMYDGSIKPVQEIEVGDIVMGDDSTPRTVLSLGQGQDEMFKVEQQYGDPYVVNSEHILCLKDPEGHIHEIEVQHYLSLPEKHKEQLHGYKVPVEFKSTPLVFDAYDVGTECTQKIPNDYKFNTRKVRLEVLAGILDEHATLKDNVYYINSKFNDLVFLARSLGLAATLNKTSIEITGQGIDQIPVRNPTLKTSGCDTNVLSYPITVTHAGQNKYYGFTLDGNNRLLMGDFTVTHNTCCAIATATSSFEKENYTILWVTRTTLKSDIWKNMFDQVCSAVVKERINAGQKIPPDFSKRMRLLSKSWKIKPMSYKQFSNLISGKNQLYKDLVAINGTQDPLRSTLIIIDEAHKLYGGSDLSAVERPNMPKLEEAIQNSYKISKDKSVRVLLMTATPITSDAMEIIKLINLCREQPLPVQYEDFAPEYLNESGKFTKKGSKAFLDKIAGSISYLSREKDARQFSQPTIVPITTSMSRSQYGYDKIQEFERQLDDTTENNNLEIASIKQKASEIKQERLSIKKELKAKCSALKGQYKKECLTEADRELGLMDHRFEDDLTDLSNQQERLATRNKDLKKELQLMKRLAKGDMSQQAMIENKCIKQKRKKAT